jgi:hypothetical protein
VKIGFLVPVVVSELVVLCDDTSWVQLSRIGSVTTRKQASSKVMIPLCVMTLPKLYQSPLLVYSTCKQRHNLSCNRHMCWLFHIVEEGS